jgi:CDP-diacylglycerol pyrophosphatase
MALWRIVHGECVPHVEAGLGPNPCERVDLDGGVEQGVAILKDLVGIAQMLAIPTRRITGIEDPQMLAPDAPPVFAVAWAPRPWSRSAFTGHCRGKQLDWRSIQNGRAARSNCMFMLIAWPFRS